MSGRRAATRTRRTHLVELVARAEDAGTRFTTWLDFEQRRWDAARAAHGEQQVTR